MINLTGLDFISLLTVEHFFMGLLAICISSGGKNVCSDAFFKWAICLFIELKNSIYSRYKSLRGIICKCSLLLCELSFHFLNVSSEAQKFLILIKSSFTTVWSLSCVQLFCNSVDYCPSGSFVHEISQARILEWVAIFLLQGIFLT